MYQWTVNQISDVLKVTIARQRRLLSTASNPVIRSKKVDLKVYVRIHNTGTFLRV